jgi:hypothetical protein
MRDEVAAPKASLVKRFLTYGATLVVAAVAIYGLSEFLSPIKKPAQGDCASLTGPVNAGRYNAADCSAPTADYLVTGTVARSQACPHPGQPDWVPVRSIDPKIRFCLVPIYAEGECYDEARSVYDVSVVDCGGGTIRVTRVSNEVPAPPCPAGAQTRAYPEVKLTYCVASP